MNKLIIESVILLIPLIFSGVLHMGVVTGDFFKFLKIPIHTRLFGKNKTYRGFVVMPLLTIPGVYISKYFDEAFNTNLGFHSTNLVWLGFWLGFFYCLFELPNSLYKRSKGIAPGKMSKEGALKHAIIDQADSGFGLIIIYYVFLNVTVLHLFLFLLLGTVIHLVLNYLLFKVGLRKEPL
jgi:hypothetical protein